MKGVDEIRSFLDSRKDFSASKDALPHHQVDREALIKVLLDLHAENLALKANMPRVNSTASGNTVAMAAGFDGTEPVLNPATPASRPTQSDAKNAPSTEPAREEKPESERLCRSMWGYKDCPRNSGEECVRQHLTICDRPTCYGNIDARATCQERTGKWHGHIKAALVMQKKRERQEAKNRKQEAEQKEFLANRKEFLKWNKAQGNGVTPSMRGKHPMNTRVVPQHAQRRENTWKPRAQRGPTNRILGDFLSPESFPPIQSHQQAQAPPNRARSEPVTTGTDSTRDQFRQFQEFLRFQQYLAQFPAL